MSDDTHKHPRPSRHQSPEAVAEQARVIEWRKEEAASPEHRVIPNGSWRTQFALWADADDEARKDIIFGMVLHDGAITEKDITRFFGISKDDLKPYRQVYEAGRAALKLKVQRNQISLGLQREDSPIWKALLGKQFAEQTSEPVHDGVHDLSENTGVKVSINVVGKDDAVTVGEQVGAALSKTLQ